MPSNGHPFEVTAKRIFTGKPSRNRNKNKAARKSRRGNR